MRKRTSSLFNRLCLMHFAALVLFLGMVPRALATFTGDTVSAQVDKTFETVFSGTATVGAGSEFTGTDGFRDYDLDITANSFTLTISKPSASGNFTGVLSSLVLSDLDYSVLSVTLNPSSSAFSNGSLAEDLSIPGQISITGGVSLNSPASALSKSLTWDVVFGNRLPEPSSALMLSLVGLLGPLRRGRRAHAV